MPNIMHPTDIIACADYCADHIAHFGTWPKTFEIANAGPGRDWS